MLDHVKGAEMSVYGKLGRKVHVHVYRMNGMAEVDLEIMLEEGVDIEEKAMGEALTLAKNGKLEFKVADNRFMAIPFSNEDLVKDEKEGE